MCTNILTTLILYVFNYLDTFFELKTDFRFFYIKYKKSPDQIDRGFKEERDNLFALFPKSYHYLNCIHANLMLYLLSWCCIRHVRDCIHHLKRRGVSRRIHCNRHPLRVQPRIHKGNHRLIGLRIHRSRNPVGI